MNNKLKYILIALASWIFAIGLAYSFMDNTNALRFMKGDVNELGFKFVFVLMTICILFIICFLFWLGYKCIQQAFK